MENERNSRRPWLAPAVVTVLAVAAATTAPVSAMVGGSISGTVTDVNGPIADIVRVCADSETTSTGSSNCVMTAADGTYTIGGLPPASDYLVVFDEPAEQTIHVPEIFDNVPVTNLDAATLVTVTEGNTTTNIDAELEIGGSIRGTVSDINGPVDGVYVCASSASALTGGCVTSGPIGRYMITGLATASDYIVSFLDFTNTYVDQLYDGAGNRADATLVAVTAGQGTASIDAMLETGGSISGTITDGNGPVAEASVTVINPANDIAERSAITAADGTYTINGLPPGVDYSIFVFDNRPGPLPPEYYDNQYSIETRTRFTVVDGATTPNIDVELGFGGSISGTVTRDGGPLDKAPVFVAVCAESVSNAELSGCAEVAADGTYTIPRLAPAVDYRVRTLSSSLSNEFFDNTPDRAAATLLSIGEGTATNGIDFDLLPKRAFHLLDQVCTVLDTGPISGGDSLDFDVAGVIPVGQNPTPSSCAIPAGADAVFANIIVENPSKAGNLRLTAAGTTPMGGIVNFAANGLNNSNAQSVPLSVDQRLNVSVNGGPAGLGVVLADGLTIEILGWYERSEETGMGFIPLTAPCAFLDTRTNQGGAGVFAGPYTSDTTLSVDVAGFLPAGQGGGNTNCGVEDGAATAALVNVVLINSTGSATVTSTDTGATIVNNIEHNPLMNNASAVVLPINANGQIDLDLTVGSGATDVRAVVLGVYYDQAAVGSFIGNEYVPLPPCATFDTRENQDAADGFVGTRLGDQTTTYDVTGSFDAAQGGKGSDCGVPEEVAAVELNLVAINPVLPGNLRAAPVGEPASGGVLNFANLVAPMNNSNAIVLPVSSDGEITVTVNGGPAGAGLPVSDIRGVITGYYI